MRVKTSCGYEFNVDDEEVELGVHVPIPIPIMENPKPIPEYKLKFLGQMFGMQKHWHEPTARRYGAHWGLKHFPPEVFSLSNEDLWDFLVQMYNSKGSLYVHHSGTSAASAEVRFPCVHESLAKELQYLLLRFHIRSRIYHHPQTKKFLVQTSGASSYMKIRPLIKETKNPKLLKRLPRLDSIVSMDSLMDSGPITDRVVELVETDEEVMV